MLQGAEIHQQCRTLPRGASCQWQGKQRRMLRAQPGTDNPPALDADVASLPASAPPAADPVPATAAVTPPDPETLNLIAVITPAGGVAFLDGDDLWWFYSDGGQRVRGRWSRSGRHLRSS
jgi:hypothetical protein